MNVNGPTLLGKQAHEVSAEQAIEALGAGNLEAGLDTDKVTIRRNQYGDNALAGASATPTWRKFVAQFKDLVILTLVFAATFQVCWASGAMRLQSCRLSC